MKHFTHLIISLNGVVSRFSGKLAGLVCIHRILFGLVCDCGNGSGELFNRARLLRGTLGQGLASVGYLS
ncbi:hypothetical protein SDC9_197906 [bioreactor metagenome]|uniref:Uncharacterized protein n=1 Tax=bioreactor metagenome TaxID=1076179 RepID=A0A645IGP8_9ZZZZ